MTGDATPLTSAEIEKLRDILDRDAVRQVLEGYVRGNDRAEEAAFRAAYWDDAYDDHGPFKGNAQEFASWAIPLSARSSGKQHLLGQSTISIKGDRASAETYYLFCSEKGRAPKPNEVHALAGRYVDTLERRDGVWKIAHRVTVVDWSTVWHSDARFWDVEKFVAGEPYPDDQVYKNTL